MNEEFTPTEADWKSLKLKQRLEQGQNALRDSLRGNDRAVQHLKDKFDHPAFIQQTREDGTFYLDPLVAAYRDGQRNVILYIESVLGK